MARYPAAQWRGPVPNVGGAMGTVRLGVVHVMEGTLAGTDGWFHDSAAQVSAHFGVGKDGTVYQWVDTNTVAWAEMNYNDCAISIEHEGTTGESLTPQQIAADQALVRWLNEVHGIPLVMTTAAGHGWVGHGQLGVAGGNHPTCPGAPILAQWSQVLVSSPSPVTPPPTNLLEVIMASATTTPGFAARYLYRLCLKREIDPGGYTASVDLLNGGGSLTQLLAAIQDSPEGQAAITAERNVFWPPAADALRATAPVLGSTPTGTAAFIRSRIAA